MKCCANCWDKSNRSCLLNPFFYYHPVFFTRKNAEHKHQSKTYINLTLWCWTLFKELSFIWNYRRSSCASRNADHPGLWFCIFNVLRWQNGDTVGEWETNGLTCVTHRGSGAGKAWLKRSTGAEVTKAEDLPKKGQRKHLLLQITTKLTETGHMLTCWEDARSTRRFKDQQRRSRPQNMHGKEAS